MDNCRSVFESKISAGAMEKKKATEKPGAETVSMFYDMEGHAKRCAETHREPANKTTEQLYRSRDAMYRRPPI